MKTPTLGRLLLTPALLLLAGATQATIIFNATLDGLQEAPPFDTPATGTATGTLSGGSGAWVFEYSISYADLLGPIVPIAGTGGHLHQAPAGFNGPVVHVLDTMPFNYTGTTDGTITGDWRYDDQANPLTDDLANALTSGDIYINLHTQASFGGEIRGQWQAVPEPGTVGLIAMGLVVLALSRRRRSG